MHSLSQCAASRSYLLECADLLSAQTETAADLILLEHWLCWHPSGCQFPGQQDPCKPLSHSYPGLCHTSIFSSRLACAPLPLSHSHAYAHPSPLSHSHAYTHVCATSIFLTRVFMCACVSVCHTRWQGRRPVVRGMAMNPVDHPMGGGRGRSKGRISQSPWGHPAKGGRTRKPRNRTDAFIHLSRHKAP